MGGDAWIPGYTVLFSPDSRSLYVNDYPRRAQLWDIATGRILWQAAYDYGAVFTPDGSTVVATRAGPVIAHLNAADGKVRRRDRLNSDQSDNLGTFRPIAVSRDGRLLAAPLAGGGLTICDIGTGAEINQWLTVEAPNANSTDAVAAERAEMQRRRISATSLAFSPEGHHVATAGQDGSIRVWDIFAGKEVLRFDGHEAQVSALAFGPDGRTLLSSGYDGKAILWSMRPMPGPAATFNALRDDIAGDAAKGYRAVWAMSADPGSVAFLREKLVAAKPPDRDRLAKLVAELDSNQFNTREAATKELESHGALAVPFLDEALKGKLSPETKSRVQRLIDSAKRGPNAAEVRQLRAVRALELAATPEAREHLKSLADGADGATLTRAATEALKRLK
jgi:hypothetical protein